MDPVASGAIEPVREDFVPAQHYYSPQVLELERERLWPKVWQVACREEELPHVGSYVTYDIMEESIVVVRSSPEKISAYFNVCQHRGRQLTEGCGATKRFRCRFHGWQYDLDGKNVFVQDPEDWENCPEFSRDDLGLVPVRVDTWAGFVFVNMDPAAEPLHKFLDPVPHYLDPFEIAKMRYRWYVSIKLPCNWKVATDSFNEGYHTAATHPELLESQGEDGTRSRTFGRHGMFGRYPEPRAPFGAPSPRLNRPPPEDLRQGIVTFFELINRTLSALYSPRDAEATRRLLTEADPSATPDELLGKALEFQREAAIAAGAGWPDITFEQLRDAGIDWHVFPNLIILPYPDAVLAYRALPDEKDPDSCIFEVYSLQRYAPGAEPKLERQRFHGTDDYRDFAKISHILQQDFSNMGKVQRGMKSRGFRGARTSPMQESAVSNFHRTLQGYLFDGRAAG